MRYDIKAMKTRFVSYALGVCGALAVGGCSSTAYTSASRYTDDLYATHDRSAIAAEAARRAEAERAAREYAAARRGAESRVDSYLGGSDGYADILADDYESAYERRLRGFESPTYRTPTSYYNYRYGDSYNATLTYDPSQYNVIVMGNEVWVEPKYLTSMFGTWGSPMVNFNFGFGSPFWWGYNDWYWGWRNYYWGNPWWGGPSWGWNGWYPGWGWDPWWPSYNHGWYRPRHDVSYRPSYQRPSSGTSYGGGRRPNSVTSGGRYNSGSATQRPTSSYQYNGGRTGTRVNVSGSTGSSSYDRGNNTYRGNSTSTSRPQSTYTPSTSTSSSPSGSYGRTGSGSTRSSGSRGR